METKTPYQKERQYDIDWLRILLILSVFLFHIGMIFNTWGWHIKNNVHVERLDGVMEFLHYWRLPTLFLVSGVGTWLALGKRTSGQYLKERFKRLFIPFVAGIFILVPVQVYTEKASQYDSLLAFYPHMFQGIYPGGNFSWHHLWFILYLFTIALIISPFLKRMKSNGFTQFRERCIVFFSGPMAMNLILVPLLLSQILLRPIFPQETHALFNDWAFFSLDLVFFLAGLILVSNTSLRDSIMQQRWLYLSQTILTTTFMFLTPHLFGNKDVGETVWDIAAIFVAWSCSLTAIGFTRRHLNRNSMFRKVANEAIYPFYLLHQPVIIVVGYYVIEWPIPILMKALIITGLSFLVVVTVYWFIIRPVNVLRIIFGLKQAPKTNNSNEVGVAHPIAVPTSNHRCKMG